jgi:dihydroneopterin aldolase / 2-amino-4-hydroxy-6-hydroxymethyldihydropteridine diphosphokinase
MELHHIYLGLGSNLGDRKRNLEESIRQINEFSIIKKSSSIYETEPWGLKDQPKFLNQVILAETNLTPKKLLMRLKTIEQKMGRKKTVLYGPRLIDLDILFYDDLMMKTPDLIIPHPHITERAFVLVPLAEIVPNMIHLQYNKTIKALLQDVDKNSVSLYED